MWMLRSMCQNVFVLSKKYNDSHDFVFLSFVFLVERKEEGKHEIDWLESYTRKRLTQCLDTYSKNISKHSVSHLSLLLFCIPNNSFRERLLSIAAITNDTLCWTRTFDGKLTFFSLSCFIHVNNFLFMNCISEHHFDVTY
jgi:hypothetical protein